MFYIYTNFHVPNINGLLFIIIKLKAKYKFRITAMLFVRFIN
jgi:hypothetical protein